MKKWVIIDDAVSARGSMFETITDAKTAEEAEAMARDEWARLTKLEQQKRDGFFVGLCDITPEIESGEAYYTDTMTDIITIK